MKMKTLGKLLSEPKEYRRAKKLISVDIDKAMKVLEPVIQKQKADIKIAKSLIQFVCENELPIDFGLVLFAEVFSAHKNDEEILINIGNKLDKVRDINNLNAPPPDHPLFQQLMHSLTKLIESHTDTANEFILAEAASHTARLMARQHDELAEKYYARLVQLRPDLSWTHYNQGLFFKTRGRFAEGVAANKKSLELSGDKPEESTLWNLGICATGAGQADIALQIWKQLGNKIEMGRFGLPEGKYHTTKVKLCEFPLAERNSANDDPGLEETIWIERLSPCHGIIRSVLYYDIGINYGDVVLFDGAPITTHRYGDKDIPVFPHLATLHRQNYKLYSFAAVQTESGQINALDKDFDNEVVIYPHTENHRILCSDCWNNKNIDHARHREKEEHHVVTGKIACPPDISPGALLRQIDKSVQNKPGCKIFCPDLCNAAQLSDRAKIEERRYTQLKDSDHLS